jgi:hypothetical protein
MKRIRIMRKLLQQFKYSIKVLQVALLSTITVDEQFIDRLKEVYEIGSILFKGHAAVLPTTYYIHQLGFNTDVGFAIISRRPVC